MTLFPGKKKKRNLSLVILWHATESHFLTVKPVHAQGTREFGVHSGPSPAGQRAVSRRETGLSHANMMERCTVEALTLFLLQVYCGKTLTHCIGHRMDRGSHESTRLWKTFSLLYLILKSNPTTLFWWRDMEMNIDPLLGCGLQLLQSSSNSFRSKRSPASSQFIWFTTLKKKQTSEPTSDN